MADAHSTAELQLGTRLLAGDEDRLAAVAFGLDLALGEADRPALAFALALTADDRLKALEVQAVGKRLLLPA
jgi:hypothetical protein